VSNATEEMIVFRVHNGTGATSSDTSFSTTIEFAQRVWQFEIVNLNTVASLSSSRSRGLVAVIVVALICIISFVTMGFVYQRYVVDLIRNLI
jgi:hypothetical protein